MFNLEISLIAYLIDLIFGEFKRITHPVVLMGRYILWFEKNLYKDTIARGAILTVSLIFLVGGVSYLFESILLGFGSIGVVFAGVLASTTIANKMLFDSVKEIISNPKKIKFLVSRDTKNLSPSEINKASIETFAENLSDGVIAPLFYLIFFGLSGAFVYKAINTLDSMVGYKTPKYKNFGKVSAKLDDIANFIPARVTALLIAILSAKRESFKFRQYAKLHDSPNAGYPISAMALALEVRLGGSCYYFGELKQKPFFGNGRENITKNDIKRALKFKKRVDILILTGLFCAII